MRLLLLSVLIFVSLGHAGAQDKLPDASQTAWTFYQVRQGETIYSISRRFLVGQSELVAANPSLVLGLKAGQMLKIPGAGSGSGADQGAQEPLKGRENTPVMTEYKVRKGESVYFIARRFGIGVEDILKYNPEARDGIEKKDILLIPDREDLKRIKKAREEAVRDSLREKADQLRVKPSQEVQQMPDRFAASRTYQVCLLLPFYLPANDTLNRSPETPEEWLSDSLLTNGEYRVGVPFADSLRRVAPKKVYPRSENFLHFYEGFLLAADSLKRAGMKMEIQVFDTNQKRFIVDSLVNSGSLKNCDLIVGPMFPELQKPVADFAFRHQIPMVSPLSSSGNFEAHNPWFFKVNPVKKLLVRETAAYVSREYSGSNVIALRVGEYSHLDEGELVGLLREKFGAMSGTGGIGRFHEYRPIANGVDGLKALLQKDRMNVFIIPSDTEAQVSVAVTTLNSLANEYPVTLIGLPGFQRFKSIQTEYLHRTGMNILTPYFVDYTSPLVNQFIRKFRRNFSAEPNQYSFQGYDVAFYFMSALFRYGKDFTGFLPEMETSLLQSYLSFERVNEEGGYMNDGLFILEYTPDFEIKSKGVAEQAVVQ